MIKPKNAQRQPTENKCTPKVPDGPVAVQTRVAYAVDAVSVLMILLAAAAVSAGGVQPVDTTHTGATNERKGALGRGGREHEQRRGVIDHFRAQEPHTGC